MKLFTRIIISLFSISILLPLGCAKKDPVVEPEVSIVKGDVKATSETFEAWYLWYKEIPELDLSLFDSPDEYIDEIRFEDDKWSFAAQLDVLVALIKEGESTGWGAGLKWDAEDNLRIAFVYDDSSMGRAEVKRGWIIKALDGKLLSEMSDEEINSAISNPVSVISFITLDGTEKEISISKDEISINTVLHQSIFERGGEKIGYLVFNEFLDVSDEELDGVFSSFISEGVSSIILDLRYNGGGTLDAANHLVGLLAGADYNNQVFNRQQFNDKLTRENKNNLILTKPNSLTPQELVIITAHSTASASELVIAGLVPFLPITLIGTTTHGKPVGMNIFSVEEFNLAIGPVSFRNVNSQGFTDYFDGIAVNYTVNDDLTKGFGDEDELCLKAALNYLESGSIGDVAMKRAIPERELLYWGVDNPVRDLLFIED
jgi:C-terminal processing protease CtpA/Prc